MSDLDGQSQRAADLLDVPRRVAELAAETAGEIEQGIADASAARDEGVQARAFVAEHVLRRHVAELDAVRRALAHASSLIEHRGPANPA